MVIVDLIGKIVETVSNNITPQLVELDENIKGVHYLHGHPIEIIETLAQRDKSNSFRFKKYPLVALFQDIPENNTGSVNAPLEVTLHMIIARATRPEYKAHERYNKNFRPYLYPIYKELLKQINLSGYFLIYDSSVIPHVKFDRLYWGRDGLFKNSANIFDDFLDGIEIKNLKLKLYKKTCELWQK